MGIDLEFILNELAQYIFSENVNDIESTSYKKEEIRLDANDKTDRDIYSKFRKIETNNYWSMNYAEIFYKQAKLVENFETTYDNININRNSYSAYRRGCTYRNFSFSEFKKYFAWRTKVRKGIIEPIEFEYHNIYINELLNKIGCKDVEDALQKLICFWKEYRKYNPWIDNIMKDNIKEFCIINGFKKPYSEIIKLFPIEVKLRTKELKDINKGVYKDKIEFLNDISKYKILKSKFLETEYGYLINQCIERVFLKLQQELVKYEVQLKDILLHKHLRDSLWQPVMNYTVYQKNEDKEFIFDGTEKYEFKNGTWSRTLYTCEYRFKNTIGYILKTIEYYVREYLGYRKLKFPEQKDIKDDLTMLYESKRDIFITIYEINLDQIIKSEIIKYLEENRIPRGVFSKKKEDYIEKEEKIEVVFNQNEFARIREKSEKIQKALIIEEPREDNESLPEIINFEEKRQVIKEVAENIIPMDKPSEQESNVFKQFTLNLTEVEKKMMQVLLKKEDVENKMFQIAQEQNQMLEVMVSNINDKALDIIGDTIIEADMSSIYEDYEKEIKNVL